MVLAGTKPSFPRGAAAASAVRPQRTGNGGGWYGGADWPHGSPEEAHCAFWGHRERGPGSRSCRRVIWQVAEDECARILAAISAVCVESGDDELGGQTGGG
jgi:hypothetical protein